MNSLSGVPNPQIPGSRSGDPELGQRSPWEACGVEGRAGGERRRSHSNSPGCTQGACAAPRPAPDREGVGRSDKRDPDGALPRRRNFSGRWLRGAGELRDRKRARSQASVPVTNSVAARLRSGAKRTQALPTAFHPGALFSGARSPTSWLPGPWPSEWWPGCFSGRQLGSPAHPSRPSQPPLRTLVKGGAGLRE